MIVDEQNYIIHVVHSVAVVDGLGLNDHGPGVGVTCVIRLIYKLVTNRIFIGCGERGILITMSSLNRLVAIGSM